MMNVVLPVSLYCLSVLWMAERIKDGLRLQQQCSEYVELVSIVLNESLIPDN